MSGPLTGLHVVECASFVAGPTGCLTLAQLGASVVRIDPLGGGSDRRRWPVVGDGEGPEDAESYYWTSLNKGKRSVAVDIRSDEGRELVTALATAPGPDRGVLVDNVVEIYKATGGSHQAVLNYIKGFKHTHATTAFLKSRP